MSVRNKFLIILGVIFSISLTYYLLSTPRNKDLILIGTVDSNQVIVSPQIEGRLAKLLVDEFDIKSMAGSGTTVTMTKWAPA